MLVVVRAGKLQYEGWFCAQISCRYICIDEFVEKMNGVCGRNVTV